MADFDDQEASSHTTDHMSGHMTGRFEIVGRVSGRRRWTVEQKLDTRNNPSHFPY